MQRSYESIRFKLFSPHIHIQWIQTLINPEYLGYHDLLKLDPMGLGLSEVVVEISGKVGVLHGELESSDCHIVSMEHSMDVLSIALSDAQVQAELEAISIDTDFDDDRDAGDSAWNIIESVNSTPSR